MDEVVFSPGLVFIAPGPVMFALNVGAATLVVGLIAVAFGFLSRRASLPLHHGMLCVALLLMLGSPIPVWFASELNFGYLPILVEEANPDEGDLEPSSGEPAGTASDLSTPATTASIQSPAAPDVELRFATVYDSAIESVEGIDNPATNTVDLGVYLLNSPANRSRLAVVLSTTVKLFLLIWGCVALGLIGRLIRGLAVIRRLRRSLHEPADPRLIAAAGQLARDDGLRARVAESPLAAGPLTLGWWRPVIVIPQGLPAVLSDDQLACILEHEWAHVRRRDVWIGLLQQLTTAIFWWNPFLHFLSRQLSLFRERLCDDIATIRRGNGIPLAEAMVRVAEWSAARSASAPLSHGLLESANDLEARVRRLTNTNRSLSRGLNWLSAGSLGGFGLLLGALMLLPILRADEGPTIDLTQLPPDFGVETVGRMAGEPDFRSGPPVLISISGQIQATNQQPIAGANVSLLSEYGDGPRHRSESPVAVTQTDREGRYQFHNVPIPTLLSLWGSDHLDAGGRFQIAAESEGYGIGWSGMHFCSPAPRPDDPAIEDPDPTLYPGDVVELNLTLGPARSLKGRINDSQGRPVAGASIDLCDLDHLDRASGVADGSHLFQNLSLLRLLPGKFHFAESDADGQFEIQGLPAESVASVMVEHSAFASQSLLAASSDSDLTDGRYALGQHEEIDFTGKSQRRYSLWKGPPVPSPVEIRLPSTRRILVQVVHDGDGTPVEDIGVSAASMGRRRTHMSGQKTDQAGHAELRLPPGEHTVHLLPALSSDDLRMSHTITVENEPAEQSFRFSLTRGCPLTLEVIDARTGKGIPGVRFTEHSSIGTSSGHLGFFTNQEGRCHALVAPGVHRYAVEIAEGYPDIDPWKTKEVDCAAGQPATLRFRLLK